MEAARHLHVVDTDSGEVFPEENCPGCSEREQIMGELEKKQRGLLLQIANLKRDQEAAARASGQWPVAVRLFAIWRKATGRKRCQFSFDRFNLVEPFLREYDRTRHQDISADPGPPRTPVEEAIAAIIGRATDHYSVSRPNGTTRHFNEWERIFKNRGEFDESVARRPRDWRERALELDPGPRDI